MKRFFCDVARSLGYTVYVDPTHAGTRMPGSPKSYVRRIGARGPARTITGPAILLIDLDKGIRERGGAAYETFNAVADRCRQFTVCIVSDDSFTRAANVRDAMARKLRSFRTLGIRGVYLDSHPRFLICGRKPAPVMRFQKALTEAGVPRDSFVGVGPSS